ncbi:TetR/AcrR family transcriptional regulator [Maritimibacter dapengensis]|uniref:TetR/AcrR family transcriptional regulator n=1 Tax=Maritimibacter dapengensis TaxID=2836868 RepID=A0ABS6T5E5_9RHOB|nr:TetR/AcrR family transcriptional regulator [Maritimibacter dapengensis]MBV7380457.1 TetR/AcrR family transcriptional regulator [Maritimibacter dapengensis]
MREDKRAMKREMIATAAYALIEERGYAGTSMLAVAKAAKASNETLYNWYGDKLGLFAALVEANAQVVSDALEAERSAHSDPLEALERTGAALCRMVLGPRAIALNRAAAADPTGALGEALARNGRDKVAPLFSGLVRQAIDAGRIKGDAGEIAETFIALLLADTQIRRATHATPPPEPGNCEARAAKATSRICRLFPV